MKLKRILVIFAVLSALFGCQSEKNVAVPDDLVGLWKTLAPKYADRYLEFTRDSIIFRAGEKYADIHPIRNIKEVRKDKNIWYTISYLNQAGQEYRFSFIYDSANDGVIRMKNQDHIEWTKETQ